VDLLPENRIYVTAAGTVRDWRLECGGGSESEARLRVARGGQEALLGFSLMLVINCDVQTHLIAGVWEA
jgi:hypothetical protein